MNLPSPLWPPVKSFWGSQASKVSRASFLKTAESAFIGWLDRGSVLRRTSGSERLSSAVRSGHVGHPGAACSASLPKLTDACGKKSPVRPHHHKGVRVRNVPADSESAWNPPPRRYEQSSQEPGTVFLAPAGKVVLQIVAEFITGTIQRSRQLITY